MADRHADLDDLADLLDRERAALVGGDLDLLSRMTAEKEALVARVARLDPPPPGLEPLRRAAARNGELLQAAQQGIRAAAARLKALAGGGEPLVTYDGYGRRQTLGAPAGNSVTRRA